VVAVEANNPEGGGGLEGWFACPGLEGLRQGGILICVEYKNGMTIKCLLYEIRLIIIYIKKVGVVSYTIHKTLFI
jgi:hypothetical protein